MQNSYSNQSANHAGQVYQQAHQVEQGSANVASADNAICNYNNDYYGDRLCKTDKPLSVEGVMEVFSEAYHAL